MRFTADLPEEFVHPEFKAKLHKLHRIKDILASSKEVKHGPRCLDYILPYHEEDKARYERRRERAHFANWFGILMGRLGGKLLRKEPTLLASPGLQDRLDRITKTGKSWKQLVAAAADVLLSYTHGGVLLNLGLDSNGFPDPYLTIVKGLTWTNWRFDMVNERSALVQVDLKSSYAQKDPKRETPELKTQFIRLRLVQTEEGPAFLIQTYRKNDKGKWLPYGGPVVPRVFGRPLDFIPFRPLWPNSCDDMLMPDPVADPVAEMTVDFLRNSANAEKSLADASIIQPIASGVKHIFGPDGQPIKELVMGSPEAWALDEGGNFALLEAQGVGARLNMEAMDKKEKRLEKMVADFVDRATVPETATATNFRHFEASHALAVVADSLTETFRDVFGWVARLTLNPEPTFSMNKEFDSQVMTPGVAREWADKIIAIYDGEPVLIHWADGCWQQGPKPLREDDPTHWGLIQLPNLKGSTLSPANQYGQPGFPRDHFPGLFKPTHVGEGSAPCATMRMMKGGNAHLAISQGVKDGLWIQRLSCGVPLPQPAVPSRDGFLAREVHKVLNLLRFMEVVPSKDNQRMPTVEIGTFGDKAHFNPFSRYERW